MNLFRSVLYKMKNIAKTRNNAINLTFYCKFALLYMDMHVSSFIDFF